MYTFSNYLAYILYPPLYIAGPIITFNDFMWQVGLDLFMFRFVPQINRLLFRYGIRIPLQRIQ